LVAIGVFKIHVVVLSCVDSSKRLQEIKLDTNCTGCVIASYRTYLVELSLIKSWVITFMIIYMRRHTFVRWASQGQRRSKKCAHINYMCLLVLVMG